MTYEEALELFNSDDLQEVICHSRLCNYTSTGCSDCPFTHMSIRIREALEKQIPKLVKTNGKYMKDFGIEPYDQVFCPNCGKRIRVKYKGKFCDKCGQKLKWSDDNEN